MAELSSENRAVLVAKSARENSQLRENYQLTKSQHRALYDAVDTWINDNAASYNNALPEPAKTTMTAKQKARVFVAVITRRWEIE